MTPTNEEIIKGNRVIAENLKKPKDWETIIGKVKTRLYYNPVHDSVNCADYELEYHSSWDWLMPAIELIRDQMGLHTVWQTMKALQENYAKVESEDFQTITDVWKAVVIYFESKK